DQVIDLELLDILDEVWGILPQDVEIALPVLPAHVLEHATVVSVPLEGRERLVVPNRRLHHYDIVSVVAQGAVRLGADIFLASEGRAADCRSRHFRMPRGLDYLLNQCALHFEPPGLHSCPAASCGCDCRPRRARAPAMGGVRTRPQHTELPEDR